MLGCCAVAPGEVRVRPAEVARLHGAEAAGRVADGLRGRAPFHLAASIFLELPASSFHPPRGREEPM